MSAILFKFINNITSFMICCENIVNYRVYTLYFGYRTKSNHISSCKFFVHFTRKNLLFLFYTSTFTKYLHQFIYSTHLFNKIFIFFFFTFFIISFPFLFGTNSPPCLLRPHPPQLATLQQNPATDSPIFHNNKIQPLIH